MLHAASSTQHVLRVCVASAVSMCRVDTSAVCMSSPIMCWVVSLHVSSCACSMHNCLPSCSCAIYDGSLCTSMFGQANIIVFMNTSIAAKELRASNVIDLFTVAYNQTCLNYILLIGCMIEFMPCPGSVWCGSNSKDELKSAIASACMCSAGSSCFINVLNNTAIPYVTNAIDMFLPHYYKGSSNNNPICQDVTLGKQHAGPPLHYQVYAYMPCAAKVNKLQPLYYCFYPITACFLLHAWTLAYVKSGHCFNLATAETTMYM